MRFVYKAVLKHIFLDEIPGTNGGHMISNTEENLGDIDIKNFTVSPLNHIACIEEREVRNSQMRTAENT